MSRKGKEKENQNPQDKTPYITVQQRLARHIQSGRSWLAQEKQWLQPYDAQGVSVDKQLPIYHPSKKIAVITRKAFSYSLTCYLKEEKTQHSGQRRLLSIPIYTDDHWAVLTLYINEHDQLHSAAYIGSIQSNQQHPTPLPTQHLIVCAIKETYPNYQGTVLQHQYYHHSDKTLSASIMAENAEASIRRFYFGNRVPLRPRLWTNMPTAQKSGISAFETELPVEAQMYALSFLGPRSRAQFAQSSKNNAVLADEQHFWKQLYLAWSRYLIIPTPHKNPPEPKSYKTAFMQLYLSLALEERKLIQAAVDDNQAMLNQYWQDKTLYTTYRDRLLVIATCKGDIKLLKKLRCNFLDFSSIPLVSYSIHASKNRQKILNYFWEITNKQAHNSIIKSLQDTLAHWAAMLNQPEALVNILNTNQSHAHQADPDGDGITPLMYAMYFQHENCIAIIQGQKQLSSTKVDVNIESKVIACSEYNHFESLAILLKNGANPNSMDSFKDTALIKAATNGHTATARLLLIYGAKCDLRNKIQMTALMKAARAGHTSTARLLLNHGADSTLLDAKIGGRTALMFSTHTGKIDIVELLLSQHGADLELKTTLDWTILSCAINRSRAGSHTAVVDLLLKYGAKSDSVYTKNNKRDLEWAYSKKKHKIVCLLFTAKLLRNEEIKNIQKIRLSIKNRQPQYFTTLIKRILNNKNYWPWVTEEMRNRLRQDPLIQELGIVEKLAELEPQARGPRPR